MTGCPGHWPALAALRLITKSNFVGCSMGSAFAEHIGIALCTLNQDNEFVGNGLLDIIVAVASAHGKAPSWYYCIGLAIARNDRCPALGRHLGPKRPDVTAS